MSEVREYQTEAPVEDDVFIGQSHKRVAESIASVLTEDSSQHIIGVEGNLGAGKSTVIEILRKNLEGKGFRFVTFDADKYHTDFRAALILKIRDELLELLGKDAKQKIETLKEAVDLALGKLFKYDKEVSSSVPISTIIFSFSLLVSALQVKPTIEFLHQLINKSDELNSASGAISAILVALPLLVFGIIKLRNRDTRISDLIKKNGIDSISERIDINREVGAVELRQAFKTIESTIPEDNTVLLIIDNIDRVSPDVTRQLWSDIEVLTSLCSIKLRILLPYSEKHLSNALARGGVVHEYSGKEFITKRVPISFSAPPIVSSGWREQFDKYWQQTLPDVVGCEGTKELLDLWAFKITPRYLKSLINRIGSKVDSCPESNKDLNGLCVAAYHLIVSDNNVPLNQLLNRNLADKNSENFRKEENLKLQRTHRVLDKYASDGEPWDRQVAALHFQTTFEIAQSELLLEPLRAAFGSLDSDRIIKLKDLFGFADAFRHQISSTDADELIKVTAALSVSESGIDLINEYLYDINYEQRNFKASSDGFDGELIKGYELIQEHGIEIDLTYIRQLQSDSEDRIDSLWSNLYSTLKSGKADKKLSDLNEILEQVKRCYRYNFVTSVTPKFISEPNSHFLVYILYPMKSQLDRWDITSIIDKLPKSELITAACQRHKSGDQSNSFFSLLLSNMRIGDIDDSVSASDLLDDEEVNGKDPGKIHSIPFTQGWHASQGQGLVRQLANNLPSFASEHKDYLDQYIALCIAAFIRTCAPDESVTMRNKNQQNQRLIAAEWVSGKMSEYPDASKYLLVYLCACKFSQILTWAKNAKVGQHLTSHLESLIQEGQIYVMNISLLLNGDYVFLREHLDMPAEDILRWMTGWERHARNPREWHKQVIMDVLDLEVEAFSKQLVGELEKYSSEDWKGGIKENDYLMTKVVQYLLEHNLKLKNGKALQGVLKLLPEDEFDYDRGLVKSLTEVIDGNLRSGIALTVRSKLFKAATSYEEKRRILLYFGHLITLRKIPDSDTAEEVLAFLEHIVDQDAALELDWLLSQKISGGGWNLKQSKVWSQERLAELNDILQKHSKAAASKLAEFVKKELKS